MKQLDIAAVVFDMDGLLLDTERLYLTAFRYALKASGLPESDTLYIETIGLRAGESERHVRQSLGPSADVEQLLVHWNREIKRLFGEPIPVKSGVIELTTHLCEQRIPYTIATSTHADKAARHIHQAGIAELFPTLIGGNEVKKGKPAPDIYLAAADRLGIDPVRCIAFEDSDNGVRAAVAAGMRVIQIPDLKPPSQALLKLGHLVADDLLMGARAAGLMR